MVKEMSRYSVSGTMTAEVMFQKEFDHTNLEICAEVEGFTGSGDSSFKVNIARVFIITQVTLGVDTRLPLK